MTDVLYRWPVAAKFGRAVPKTRFYEQGAVSAAIREHFVAEVERITWAYKLSPDTVNLPASEVVPEIQVLVIELKAAKGRHFGLADVSDAVLVAIDKAIRQPVIFEVTGTRGVRTTATLKQVGQGAPKLGTYYSTGWMSLGASRAPLPTAISLTGLYASLIEPLTPVSVRPGEEVPEVAARLEAVRRLEREVATLQRKLRTELQLNRKVALRRELQDRQATLASLM